MNRPARRRPGRRPPARPLGASRGGGGRAGLFAERFTVLFYLSFSMGSFSLRKALYLGEPPPVCCPIIEIMSKYPLRIWDGHGIIILLVRETFHVCGHMIYHD